jgi:serine/threonine protein kinase
MPADPFLQQSLESVQSVQTTLAPGQPVFGGRFVLERHLGQGGMGQVWLARDTTLDEPRALKFVLPALLSDATARKRLRNEARLGTHLAHPRIVRVFDFAEETGGSPLAAVVMEFVEGRTLNELLAEQEIGFFETEQIESWVNDVIEGLRYAHEEKQRYHLDLKPGNIIIEKATNRAKLLDFGISRSAKDTITRLTGQVSSGTLPYMSPQQLDGEPPCAADDVYGLGATIYELLTGTPPFFRGKLEDQIRSKTPDSIMDRRRQNAKEGLNAGVGNPVSKEWEARVSGMLNKKAEARRLAGVSTQTPPPKQPAPLKRKVAEERPRKAESPPPAGGDNLEHLIELLRKNGPSPFMLWLLVAFIIQVALGYYAWERAGSYYEGGMDFWGLPGGVRLVIQSVLFLLFYLPLFLLGRRFKTAPWSPAGTALVFACWSCFPMAAHVLLSGRFEWSTWFYAGTVYRLLEVNLVASSITGIFWHLALGDRFIRPASGARLRRVALLQACAFVAFVSLVIYCYHLPA